MRRAFITVVLAGVLVAAGAVPSLAQVAPRTFDDLRAEAHRGEIVSVTDQGGTKVKGRVVRISATSIDLLVNDGSRKWAASDVAWITQRRGHAGRGALIGLAAGASSAVLLVLTDGECQNYGYQGCGRQDAADALVSRSLFRRHWRRRRCGYRRCDQTGACPVRGAESSSAHVFELRVAPGVIGLRAQLRPNVLHGVCGREVRHRGVDGVARSRDRPFWNPHDAGRARFLPHRAAHQRLDHLRPAHH